MRNILRDIKENPWHVMAAVFVLMLLSVSVTGFHLEQGWYAAAASTDDISDFNGDGNEDLAVGVPRESVGSFNGAGAVNVIYGSSTGLQSTGSGGPDDQYWTQDSSGINDVAENDRFGFSVASGDFNGDGYDDLAIGAISESVPITSTSSVQSAGAVNVIYGSSSGLRASPAADETGHSDQFWTQNSPGIADAPELSDQFGTSLAGADFNDDGFDDLAVGVAREGVGSVDGAGAVNVIYGSSDGLRASAIAAGNGHADQIWHQNVAGIVGVATASDLFGTSLTGADFNGDEYDDLAIGVPGDFTTNQNHGAGAVNVIYGSSDGLRASAIAAGNGHSDQIWRQDSGGIEGVSQSSDIFGIAVAAGDLNGDGFADLAIGVPIDFIADIRPGAVNVIYGSSDGLRSTAAGDGTGMIDQIWHQDKTGVMDVNEPGDKFGNSVGIADFNGDGYSDLAVGVNLEGDVGNILDAGAVNVIYGSSQGLKATAVAAGNGAADQIWTQDSTSVKDNAEAQDEFGTSLLQ